MENGDKSHVKILGASNRARNNTVMIDAEEMKSVRNQTADPAPMLEDVGAVGAPANEATAVADSVPSVSDVFDDIFQAEDEADAPMSAVVENVFDEDLFGEPEDEVECAPLTAEDKILDVSERAATDEGHNFAVSELEDDVYTTELLDSSAEQFPRAAVEMESDRSVAHKDVRGEEVSQSDVHEETPVSAHVSPVGRARIDDAFDQTVWNQTAPVAGFLVSFDNDENGSFVELREGRLLVTSELSASHNCLVINDPSVSPMHAILRVSRGKSIDVLDQLSEQGTRIACHETGEETVLSGDRGVLKHGDVVLFGARKFHVCLLAVKNN